jgi:hypothetical protein
MRVSGHGVLRKPVHREAFTTIPTGTPMDSPWWPAATTRGWRRSRRRGRAGPLRRASAARPPHYPCIIPGEKRNAVAAAQVRCWLGQAGPRASRPLFTFDAGDAAVQLRLALAHLPVRFLVRLRAARCCYADPRTQTGRPRRHGAKVVCADPPTWPTPTCSATDPRSGALCLQAWSGRHAAPQHHAPRGTRQPRPLVRGPLIRLAVAHLPRPTKAPPPRWFCWQGPPPPQLAECWQAYSARFSLHHPLRFFKQPVRWTTPNLRSPRAADRWTWLLLLAYVPLRLARQAVWDVRLPWQPPLPAQRRTPARVRRAFGRLLTPLGSPASIPQPCGHSPARPAGKRSPPATPFPAVKLTP